jgi:hypothetical protein
MHGKKQLSFFHGAVLSALALPGCGGATTPDNHDAGVALPTTPCQWQEIVAAACGWSYTFVGDPSVCVPGVAVDGGPSSAQACAATCGASPSGQPAQTCSIVAGGGNTNRLDCMAPCIPPGNGGRRPAYFAQLGFSHPPAGRAVGVHFARVACMEAGSVEAFRRMRDELVLHGAPRRLVNAATRAIRDELRHVRQTSALARRFGEDPVSPIPAPPVRPRSLEEMARENAVEGCIRETYSALECLWQAKVARDPVVRSVMTRIARDEMRHVALAWAVHRWATSRLDADARARLQAAQEDEIAVLLRELAKDPAESLVATAGLPRAVHSSALVGAIAERALN